MVGHPPVPLIAEDIDPSQTEARVSTHVENVQPTIPTSMPAPSIVDMTAEDTSDDTSA